MTGHQESISRLSGSRRISNSLSLDCWRQDVELGSRSVPLTQAGPSPDPSGQVRSRLIGARSNKTKNRHQNAKSGSNFVSFGGWPQSNFIYHMDSDAIREKEVKKLQHNFWRDTQKIRLSHGMRWKNEWQKQSKMERTSHELSTWLTITPVLQRQTEPSFVKASRAILAKLTTVRLSYIGDCWEACWHVTFPSVSTPAVLPS